MTVSIDGSVKTGRYRCECECGATWNGKGELLGRWWFSPALPVAEAVVHMRIEHPVKLLEVRFTERFGRWLENHWELANLRAASALEVDDSPVLR